MATSSARVQPPGSALRPRAPRAPLAHAAVCRYEGEAEFIEVTTLNISESGMLVRSSAVPAIGARLEFKFLLEQGFEILAGVGTVSRAAQDADGAPTIGIAFGELDPSKRRILARIVELHSEPDE